LAAQRRWGISYFHQFAYDLIAENERIIAAASIPRQSGLIAKHNCSGVVVVSSSMVFETATTFPTTEGAQLTSPPPISTYGFRKLACEYFARGAWEQYQLPYTIVRPFNCVGIGESRALNAPEILSNNVKLAMSHVVPTW
jgi:UDP-glucose 4-epimerase